MAMTYLRKTATYTVLRENGEELYVDEFESEEHPGMRRVVGDRVSTRLLLRNGDRATMIDERTFMIAKTGERLTVIRKE